MICAPIPLISIDRRQHFTRPEELVLLTWYHPKNPSVFNTFLKISIAPSLFFVDDDEWLDVLFAGGKASSRDPASSATVFGVEPFAWIRTFAMI